MLSMIAFGTRSSGQLKRSYSRHNMTSKISMACLQSWEQWTEHISTFPSQGMERKTITTSSQEDIL
jgi:hypothetical protein